MPSPSESGLLLIGWKEYLDFPEWGLKHVRAKIDTGARTSALDVVSYEMVEAPDGPIARMRLALRRRFPDQVQLAEAPVVRTTAVKNSGGAREIRPVVEALVHLGPVLRRIQLTLTQRQGLLCPILLGRRALADTFLVDVSRKYLLRR